MEYTQSEIVSVEKIFVYILGVAGFISAADNWIVSPILPAIAKGLGGCVPAAGAVFIAYRLDRCCDNRGSAAITAS